MVIVVVTALGVAADVAGVFDAPPILQIVIAIALAMAAGWTLLRGHRWAFISSSRRTSVGIAVAAAIVLSNGVYHAVADEQSAQQAATNEVCAAAEDYREAYTASATQWAATGLRTSDTERADTLAAQSLDRLSQAATRSGNEDFKVVVHDMRMRGNLGRAVEKVDMSQATTNLQGSWTSLKVLISLCKEKGYPVTEYSRLPIQPNIERACQLVDEMLTMTGSMKGKMTPDQQKQFIALVNMFMYHGVNAPDERFSAKALEFVNSIGKVRVPSDDRMGAVYGSCVARGYTMKMARDVPPEYVVP